MYFYGAVKIQFMVILANKNIPVLALQQLSAFGELILLQTENITYPAISGHPDIFFCLIDGCLVMAPNVPDAYKIQLSILHLDITEGYEPVGHQYPESARYNCVVLDRYLIGNTEMLDKKIVEKASGKEIIHVNQGYTRCNLLALPDGRFITSDRGIESALTEKGKDVMYVNPEGIQLPGFKHGFFGGTAGIFENQIYFLGSLDHFLEGEKIRQFLSEYQIIELYKGPLFDGGGLICIP